MYTALIHLNPMFPYYSTFSVCVEREQLIGTGIVSWSVLLKWVLRWKKISQSCISHIQNSQHKSKRNQKKTNKLERKKTG